MNIVHSGNTYQVYGDSLKTYTELPVGSYEVNFNKFQGFYLTSRSDLAVNEDKIYGDHDRRVTKILRSFKGVNRNFGVLVSGPKGVGKSLMARVLANRAAEAGYPLINVSGYIPGIADFIASIEQEVVVLFDEFEKTFASNDNGNPQEEMLSLFDGIDNGKKLFVVTVNEVNRLNTYLLNRPGRFHYHFIIGNPDAGEVAEYMTDKLLPEYHNLIPAVVAFSTVADATYDVLRAISYELNQGYSLEESLLDLNIAKESTPYYRVAVHFADGYVAEATERVNLYGSGWTRIWFTDNLKSINSFRMDFRPSDINIDINKGLISLDPSKVQRYLDDDDFDMFSDEEIADKMSEAKARPITKITFTRIVNHYGNKYNLAV